MFFVVVFIAIIVPIGAFAYDNDIAHPGIAELAAKLYNEKFNPDLTSQEIEWIKQGAREEDFPTRWLNHFWDPIYKTGFSDLAGFSFSKAILDWFKLTSVYSAPVWIQNTSAQRDYSLGDRSWETGLLDYAYNNRKMAFIELGHAVHLISDMSVPAHTRNSEHIGDPYEGYVKANWQNIRPTISASFIGVNNLNSVFNLSALYSNNNFYSEKTIESKKYLLIPIDEVETKYENGIPFFYYTNINGYIYCSVGANWKGRQLTTSKQIILSSYAQHLIPKAVGDSAGLIKYFLDEAEKKKEEVVQKTVLSRLVDKLNATFRISQRGLLNQALGYLIGSGEKVKDYYDAEFAQTPIEPTPIATKAVKVAGEKITANPPPEQPKPEQDNQANPPKQEPSEEIIDNNFDRFADLLPPEEPEEQIAEPSTSTPVYSPYFDGGGSSGPTEPTAPQPPQEKPHWLAPVLDPIFSEILYTSSSEAQIFGTCATDTQSIYVFSETEMTSSTEITANTTIFDYLWTADILLTPGRNIFQFKAKGGDDFQVSVFSSTSEITRDIDPPSVPTINYTISTSTTSTLLTFTLSAEDNYPGEIFYSLEMSSGSEWVAIAENSTSAQHSITFIKSGDYIFRAKAADVVGNQSDYSEATVTILPLNYAYIYLSGTQTEIERVLTREDGPYLLDSYKVPKGKTLVINPGVVIKGLNKYSRLSASGNLTVNGEEENRVVFTALGDKSFDSDRFNTVGLSSSESAPEAWVGLSISDGSNSIINYADIRFAGGGNTIDSNLFPALDTRRAIFLTKASLAINNCQFSNNARYSIAASTGFNLNVDNSEFSGIDRYYYASNGNGSSGGIVLRNGTASINNSTFRGLSKFPVEIGSCVNLTTENLNFEDNLFNEIIYQTTAYGRYRGNGFYVLENQPLNIYTQGNFQPGNTVYIMGSLIAQNGNYSIIGTEDARIKLVILPEFGGKINVLNGSLNMNQVNIIRPAANLLSLANNSFGSFFHSPSVWNNEMSYADLWQENYFLIDSLWGNRGIIDVENGSLSIKNSTFTNFQFPFKYFVASKSNGIADISTSRFVLENNDPIIAGFISAFGAQGTGVENNGIINVSSSEFINIPDGLTTSTASTTP